MPRFAPFPGIRYAPDLPLAAVTSPPYDVIDASERARLAASHEYNAVHIDCPVGDLGGGGAGEGGGPDCYEAAASAMRDWLAGGALVVDAAPTYTAYRMSFTDEDGTRRSTIGVLGALHVDDPDVLPHERTTPKAKSDRLDLMRATQANLSAIWGLSLASGLSKLLEPSTDPLDAWTDADAVHHEVWRVEDPGVVAEISEVVSGAPIVIADGHHRYETSITYRNEVGDAVPGAAATLCFVVELVEEQLTVAPIHRLVHGLPAGFDPAPALSAAFDLAEIAAPAPGLLAAVFPDGRTLSLTPRDGDPGRLDTVRLDDAFAAFPDGAEVTYQHGRAKAVEAVRSGRADLALLVRPVTVEQISDFAHRRDRMPPKTTFFTPKPRTGIVYRSLTR